MQNRVSKKDWVAMFQEIGLDEAAMKKWHHLFETRHPDAHAEFLTWLGISENEAEHIQKWSRDMKVSS